MSPHYPSIEYKRYAVFALVSAAICLLSGVLVYACAREHILFLEWIGWHGVHYTSHEHWKDWVVYNLPDGLWYIALLLTMDVLRRMSQVSMLGKGLSWGMMVIAILLPYVLEYAQKYHIIAGTFDYADVLTYCITLLLYFVLCKTNFLFLSHSKCAASHFL